MLTQCEAHGAKARHPYGVGRSVFAVMNSSQSKDDWVKAQQHKFHKPIDVDTLMGAQSPDAFGSGGPLGRPHLCV